MFAGDHGVHAQGVTPWPQEVTVQMVANVCAGGAVVNALARQVGADVVRRRRRGRRRRAAHERLTAAKVARGTADLSVGPAMTPDQARRAVEAAGRHAYRLVDAGYRLLVTGDLGLANTTPSAALVAALTGTDPSEVTGRGAGSDDVMLAHKVDVVRRAVSRLDPDADPMTVLAEVGGFEHAALAGFLIGAAARRVPVVLDGVIAALRRSWPPPSNPASSRTSSPATGPRNRGRPWRCERSASNPSSTSTSASARGPARCWPSRSSRPPPGCSPRWRRFDAAQVSQA